MKKEVKNPARKKLIKLGNLLGCDFFADIGRIPKECHERHKKTVKRVWKEMIDKYMMVEVDADLAKFSKMETKTFLVK